MSIKLIGRVGFFETVRFEQRLEGHEILPRGYLWEEHSRQERPRAKAQRCEGAFLDYL